MPDIIYYISGKNICSFVIYMDTIFTQMFPQNIAFNEKVYESFEGSIKLKNQIISLHCNNFNDKVDRDYRHNKKEKDKENLQYV